MPSEAVLNVTMKSDMKVDAFVDIQSEAISELALETVDSYLLVPPQPLVTRFDIFAFDNTSAVSHHDIDEILLINVLFYSHKSMRTAINLDIPSTRGSSIDKIVQDVSHIEQKVIKLL